MMKILSRLFAVTAILGGLGFGSYAFGKYVLSNKLFGPGGENIRPRGESDSRVDIERLPPADPPAPNSETQVLPSRPNRPANAAGDAENSLSSTEANNFSQPESSVSEEPTPRPRRKKRRDNAENSQQNSRDLNGSRDPESSRGQASGSSTLQNETPARQQNQEERGSDFGPRTEIESPAPQIEVPRASSDAAPPKRERTRERERERVNDSAPETPRRRREPVTENAPAAAPRVPIRERERAPESPVPVPEGDESPVPLPG